MMWQKRLKRLKRFGKEHRLLWRASSVGRMVRRVSPVVAGPVDNYQRRRAAARYNQQFPSNRMPVEDGYTMLPAGSVPGTADIVDTCRRLFVEKKAMLEAKAPSCLSLASPGDLTNVEI